LIVRSNRLFDVVVGVLLGALTTWFARAAMGDDIYFKRCNGRSAWLCELTKSTRDYELLGLNPIMLAFAGLMAVSTAYCARRAWFGWSARLSDGRVSVPGFFGMNHLLASDVVAVEVRPKLFSTMATINVTGRNSQRLSAANAKIEDAEAFSRALNSRNSAPPATPPAT
jgi:hypothetical protein